MKNQILLSDVANIKKNIHQDVFSIINSEWNCDLQNLKIERTSENFEGDYSITLFSIAKKCKVSVKQIADKLISSLINQSIYSNINHTNGFLNFTLNLSVVFEGLVNIEKILLGTLPARKEKYLVEYSSPNTNKPLHLGHLRTNFLGQSITNILSFLGYDVHPVCIVNDRGIHICKSMAAYILFGENSTPESLNMKGDKFVGHFYVLFDKENKKQISELLQKGFEEEHAKKETPIMKFAYDLLIKWEKNDPQIIELWHKMNSWVYQGWEATYEAIGTKFEKTYYESETYLLGKDIIKEGLEKEVFYKKSDESVWIDLQDCGLDSKLVLRGDGTSVYITQDLGTFKQRYDEFNFDKCIYVVGNEQDYHFKVLFEIIGKFDEKFKESLYHLSYGMVELPNGKMKSREGTVVDADDLIEETIALVRENCQKSEKKFDICGDLDKLYKDIALGAIKFHFIKVDSTKKIVYNPAEALDFQGHTGVFIQYTHARIQSLLEKSEVEIKFDEDFTKLELSEYEKKVSLSLFDFFASLESSGNTLSPSILANHLYELAKVYNKFYAAVQILAEENLLLRSFRLYLSSIVCKSVKLGLVLLSIEAPNRM